MAELFQAPNQSQFTPEQLALGERLYRLFSYQEFGHSLPDCYNDIGSPLWDYFEKIQSHPGLKQAYDVAVLGVEMVRLNAERLAQIVLEDPDLDTDNLIVVEKGGGSPDATRLKTLIILNALRDAGINVRLYANIEGSAYFREQNRQILKQERPDLLVNELDNDFQTDDPDLSFEDFVDEGQPRLVIELGSPRSNVPTKSQDELPTKTLENYFTQDAKLCKGGLLFMDCDSTQDREINEGMYAHPAHGKVGEALPVYGQRQGVIRGDFEPMWFFYQPTWEAGRSLLKHELVSIAQQNFEVLRDDGQFHPVFIAANQGPDDPKGVFAHSHSFKWQPNALRDAARKGGNLEQRAFFPMIKDGVERVNGYVFKPN